MFSLYNVFVEALHNQNKSILGDQQKQVPPSEVTGNVDSCTSGLPKTCARNRNKEIRRRNLNTKRNRARNKSQRPN